MVKEQVAIQKEQPVTTHLLQLPGVLKRMEELINLNIGKINIKIFQKVGGMAKEKMARGLSDSPAFSALARGLEFPEPTLELLITSCNSTYSECIHHLLLASKGICTQVTHTHTDTQCT